MKSLITKSLKLKAPLIGRKLRSKVEARKEDSPMLWISALLIGLSLTGCAHLEDQDFIPVKPTVQRVLTTRITWNNRKIRAATVTPLTWTAVPESAGQLSMEADGTVIHAGSQRFAAIVSDQQFTGDGLLEYKILDRGGILYSHPAYVAIVPAVENKQTDFLWGNVNDHLALAALKQFASPKVSANKDDVFGIEVHGQTVKYYRNHTLIYTSDVPFTFSSYKIRVYFNGFQDAALSTPSVSQN